MQGQGAIIFPSDFADAGGAKVVKKVLLRFPLPSHFWKFRQLLNPSLSPFSGILCELLPPVSQCASYRRNERPLKENKKIAPPFYHFLCFFLRFTIIRKEICIQKSITISILTSSILSFYFIIGFFCHSFLNRNFSMATTCFFSNSTFFRSFSTTISALRTSFFLSSF